MLRPGNTMTWQGEGNLSSKDPTPGPALTRPNTARKTSDVPPPKPCFMLLERKNQIKTNYEQWDPYDEIKKFTWSKDPGGTEFSYTRGIRCFSSLQSKDFPD
jgi:hypothetical protein